MSGFFRRARSVLRDRRTWIIAGGGALLGAAVAGGLLTAPWNGPDRVLHVDPDAPPINTTDYQEWLSPLGIDLDGGRVFESVNGVTPWVVPMADGGRCLVLSPAEGSGILNVACAGKGVDPMMDVLPALWGLNDARQGATIRLVAHDATIEVWFSGPQPTTDSAASRSLN